MNTESVDRAKEACLGLDLLAYYLQMFETSKHIGKQNLIIT